MLSLLFILFYALNTQPCNGEEKTANLCTLPPHPKNGRYELLDPETPNLSPGDKLNSYTLEVKCDPGFNNTGHVIFTCFEDGTTFGEVSECLPQCKREKNDVLSCGLGVSGVETRCVAPAPSWDDDIRSWSQYTPENEEICGLPAVAQVSIISGGRIAVRDELPWHAGIYTKKKTPYMQICGGSLVSETVVISAAHCFWNERQKQLPASDYAVAVGKMYRPWNDQHDEYAQKSDVAEIKIPPRFQGSATNLQDDIALVIVSSPFKYIEGVRPVCLDFDMELDKKHLEAGHEGKVAGWGLTGEDGPASPVLKVVEMPVVAIDQCIDKTDPTFKAHITSDKICAGYQNGTAVCKGDSGGGLSFGDQSRGSFRYFLRGVVSGAPSSDHLCNTLAWATFTHVLKHQYFIRETGGYRLTGVDLNSISTPDFTSMPALSNIDVKSGVDIDFKSTPVSR